MSEPKQAGKKFIVVKLQKDNDDIILDGRGGEFSPLLPQTAIHNYIDLFCFRYELYFT